MDNKTMWFLPCDAKDGRSCKRFKECGRPIDDNGVLKFKKKSCISDGYRYFFKKDKVDNGKDSN